MTNDEQVRRMRKLWNLVAGEQEALPDPPDVAQELRMRKARFAANPSSGVTWETAKAKIRSGFTCDI